MHGGWDQIMFASGEEFLKGALLGTGKATGEEVWGRGNFGESRGMRAGGGGSRWAAAWQPGEIMRQWLWGRGKGLESLRVNRKEKRRKKEMAGTGGGVGVSSISMLTVSPSASTTLNMKI